MRLYLLIIYRVYILCATLEIVGIHVFMYIYKEGRLQHRIVPVQLVQSRGHFVSSLAAYTIVIASIIPI